jgi:hypothetical protein
MSITRCLASLLLSITASSMVSCSSDTQEGTALCDTPAPLLGQLDPSAPGYLFTFEQGVNTTAEVERLSGEYSIEVTAVFDAVGGFAATMPEEAMQQLRCERSIARVEYNASGDIHLGVDVVDGVGASPSHAPSL